MAQAWANLSPRLPSLSPSLSLSSHSLVSARSWPPTCTLTLTSTFGLSLHGAPQLRSGEGGNVEHGAMRSARFGTRTSLASGTLAVYKCAHWRQVLLQLLNSRAAAWDVSSPCFCFQIYNFLPQIPNISFHACANSNEHLSVLAPIPYSSLRLHSAFSWKGRRVGQRARVYTFCSCFIPSAIFV